MTRSHFVFPSSVFTIVPSNLDEFANFSIINSPNKRGYKFLARDHAEERADLRRKFQTRMIFSGVCIDGLVAGGVAVFQK